MKKIGIALLGVLVAGALFFVFTSKTGSNGEPIENGFTDKDMITLYWESGEVFFTNKGVQEAKLDKDSSSAVIQTGSQVRTVEGSAYVLFPDNSMMSIDKNTIVTIEYSKEKVSILQTLGNTYHRVKTLESGQQYEVRTPGTLAAVRGTTFAVLFDNKTKKSNVKVIESKVSVKKLDSTKPLKEAPVVLEEVVVEEGSQVDVPDTSIQITRPLAPARMGEKDKRDGGWMEKNEIVDEATEKPENRREFIEKMIEEVRKQKEGMTDKEKMDALRDQVKKFKQEKGIRDNSVSEEDNSKVLVVKSAVGVEGDVVAKPTLLANETRVDDTPNPLGDDENLPPLDPSMSDSNDPFVLEFDRRYEYWFPIYSDKATLCSRVNPLTPEILKARLIAFETTYKGTVPNKDGILNFLRALKLFCSSSDIDNRILDEGYTENYPF